MRGDNQDCYTTVSHAKPGTSSRTRASPGLLPHSEVARRPVGADKSREETRIHHEAPLGINDVAGRGHGSGGEARAG